MHIIDRIYAIILSFIFLFLTICNVLTLWVVEIEGLRTICFLKITLASPLSDRERFAQSCLSLLAPARYFFLPGVRQSAEWPFHQTDAVLSCLAAFARLTSYTLSILGAKIIKKSVIPNIIMIFWITFPNISILFMDFYYSRTI